jgi:Domain of unknown function (DUF4397)
MRSDRLLIPFAVVPAATVLLPTPAAFADAQVRFLQATPGTEAAGLTIVSGEGTARTTPMAFAQLSGRVNVPAGRVAVRHRAPGSGRLATAQFTLADGRDYTVVAIGPPGQLELELRADGRAQTGKARVRVSHFARELGAPDLFVDGERVVQRFPYLGATPYLALPPGRHKLAAMRPNSSSTLVSATVTLRAGTTSTAYVLGSGGQPTQALLASDVTRSTAKAATATSSRASAVHVVRPGDTLWGIARDRIGADATETNV